MGKIVLITGATSGYGLATAKKFKDNGDTVIIVSRNFTGREPSGGRSLYAEENEMDCFMF